MKKFPVIAEKVFCAVPLRHFFGVGKSFFFSCCFFIFFLIFGGGVVWGQSGVIISSDEPGPTAANPIPIDINFEDGVDEIDPLDFNVNNGNIQDITREEPDFIYEGTERELENFQVKTTSGELLKAYFSDNIEGYLKDKLKKTVISIDFNKNNELFYLTLNDGIFKVDEQGNTVGVISGNEFESPLDMVIHRDNGNIYVADAEKGQVLIFNSAYSLIRTIGTGSNADSENPRGATGLALDDEGNIFVADNFTGNTPGQDAIKIYAPNGDLIKIISTYNGQQIEDPFRIAVDKYGNIYVSESGGDVRDPRIIIFDKNYNPIKVIQGGEQGNPGSLVVDDFGYLYVIDYEDDFNLTDLFNDPLQVLGNYEIIRDSRYTVNVFDTNQDYKFVKQFDKSNLNLPIDLALDNCGGIYLNNLRLQGAPPGEVLGFPALMDINFDFTLKKFQRQDNFTAELVPEAPGLVKIILEDTDLFKCGPQPEGDFSIVYEPEEENTAPEANDDEYKTDQDEALTIPVPGVLENDTDDEGDDLTTAIVSQPENGTVTLNPDGSFIYEPAPGYFGQDTFTYVANDGNLDSNVSTVTIFVVQVVPPNTAPEANDDEYNTDQDEALTIPVPGVLENDTDDEGDDLTAEIVSNPANGTITLNPDGSFTYEPDPGYFGQDTFTYNANDGNLDSNVATVTIFVAQVVPPNTAPEANDDEYNTDQDETLTVSPPGVLKNDEDEEADELTAEIADLPENGTITLEPGGSFVYEPDPGFFGTDTFTYVASDGNLDSSPATVTITINEVIPPNTAPVANDDEYSTNQNETLTISIPGVLENDTDDEGDDLTAEIVSNPANGTITLNPDGSFTYEPAPGYFGQDTFTYVANDGNLDSNVATVTIFVAQVVPPNTVPEANDDEYNTDQDEALTVSAPGVLENDEDEEANELTAEIADLPENGTINLEPDGSFVYEPDPGFFGTDTFTYVASDGNLDSSPATVTITINEVIPPNTAPEANDDEYSTNQNETLTIPAPGVLENDTDDEGDDLTAEIVSNPANGTITLNPDGSFTYEPASGYFGQDTFTYVTNDGEENSNEATVTITVNDVIPPNIAPEAENDAYKVDQDEVLTVPAPGVLENDEDVDEEPLTAETRDLPENGTVTLNPDGSFTYEPDPGFDGTDTFTYVAFDGEDYSNGATVTITVNDIIAPNTAPEAENDFYDVDQDEVLTVPAPGVLENDEDVENSTLSAELRNNISNGVLNFNSDGSFTYEPDPGFIGEDEFTYVAFDGEDYSNEVTVTITVIAQSIDPTFDCLENYTLQLNIDGEATLSAKDLYTGDAPGVEFNLSQENFTCEDIGTQTVTLNYSGDVSGSCSIAITVEDYLSPVANCVSDFTLHLNSAGYGILSETIIDDGSIDNCGIENISLSKTRFTTADIGEQQITLTVMDAAGNIDSCESTINVEAYDDEAEGISCVDSLTLPLSEAGDFVLTLNYSGNPDNEEVEISKTNFSCEDIGRTQTVTATYWGEYTGSCEIAVTVIDNMPPQLQCVSNYSLTLESDGTANLTAGDIITIDPLDNCGVADISLSKTSFTTADIGQQEVILTVSDTSGNENTCTINVTVEPYEADSGISCFSAHLELNAQGEAILEPSAVFDGDIEDIASFELTQEFFTCEDVGVNEIGLTVVFEDGRTENCTVNITILDPEDFCQIDPVEPPETGTFVILYPNPSRGRVNIMVSEDIELKRAEVFDMRGRFLFAKQLEKSAGGIYRIDLRSLQSAVYNIVLYSDEQKFIRRAIISLD